MLQAVERTEAKYRRNIQLDFFGILYEKIKSAMPYFVANWLLSKKQLTDQQTDTSS